MATLEERFAAAKASGKENASQSTSATLADRFAAAKASGSEETTEQSSGKSIQERLAAMKNSGTPEQESVSVSMAPASTTTKQTTAPSGLNVFQSYESGVSKTLDVMKQEQAKLKLDLFTPVSERGTLKSGSDLLAEDRQQKVNANAESIAALTTERDALQKGIDERYYQSFGETPEGVKAITLQNESDKKRIDELNKQIKALEKETELPTDWGKLAQGVIYKGSDQALGAIAKSVDWVAGLVTTGVLGFSQEDHDALSPTAAFKNWVEKNAEHNRKYYAQNAQSSKAAQTIDTLGTATVAAIPQAALAFVTAGQSLPATTAGLTATAASAGASGLASTVSSAVSNMAKNPQYWLGFLNTAGESYESAKADGAGELEASSFALVNGLVNALVEVGGGGIQELPKSIRSGSGSALREWVSSAIDEGKEEVVQGVIERGFENLVYGKGNPMFSTEDANAIINPKEMAREFGLGTAVGGILGGGQMLAQSGINRAAETKTPTSAVKLDADGLNMDTASNLSAETEAASGVPYEVRRDADGNVYIEISQDILSGKPESEWKSAVRNAIQSIFSGGLKLERGTILSNKKGRGEFTNGSYTRMLERTAPQMYQDKMRMSVGSDGIVRNAENVQYEDQRHTRSDDIVGFNRGNIRVSVKGNDYSGDVLTAIYSDGKETFFDINNLAKKNITEVPASERYAVKDGFSQTDAKTSVNTKVPQTTPGVNTAYAENVGGIQGDGLGAADAGFTTVNDNPDTHTAPQQAAIEEYKRSVDGGLLAFVEKVKTLKNPRYRNSVRYSISEANEKETAAVKELSGIDATGYENIITGSAIDHIEKRHGANGKADRSMSDANDLARLPYVIENFDRAELLLNDDGTPSVSDVWKNSDGTPAKRIIFTKKIDGTYYAAVATPDSNAKVLAVESAFIGIDKGSTGTVLNMENSPQVTPETPQRANASFNNTKLAQAAPGVNTSYAESGEKMQGDGLGAADAGFTTLTRGNMVDTQDKTTTQSRYMSEEEKARFAPKQHERLTAEMSAERASQYFYNDSEGNIMGLEDTVQSLIDAGVWDAAQQDAAQVARDLLIEKARESGDWELFGKLSEAIQNQGTMVAQSLQARKKWVAQSAENIVTEAAAILGKNQKLLGSGEVMEEVTDMAYRHEEAASTDNAAELANIIRETAKTRKTTALMGKSNHLPKTAEWALERAVKNGDIEFLKTFAANGIVNIASDKVNPNVGTALKTVRRNAMLSKISTTLRNFISNNIFDPVDSVSRDISVPLDMLLSKFTKTRSVAVDKSWFSKAKREGAMDGLAKSLLEVGLDVDASGSESRYESTAQRTFSMNADGKVWGTASKVLSTWEKYNGYALTTTDEAQKGGIQREVQRGIDKLYERGLISDESLRNAGEAEAKYRTFQDETKLSKTVTGVRRAMNNIGVKAFGVGDVFLPFAQVPANLATRSLEYSPVGLATSTVELANTLVKAKTGTLTAAEQAHAVQSFGRAVNGTSMIAISVWLSANGLIRVMDTGKDDEDKDMLAMMKMSGQNGTQLNLTATLRAIRGESTEWEHGDMLMSIGFLEPMNAFLTTGALIAEDIEESGQIDAFSVAKRSVEGTFQSVIDLPVLENIRQISNQYQYSDADTKGGKAMDAVTGYIAGQAASFVPNAVKGIAQGLDTTQRDLYTAETVGGKTKDAVVASLPGLREKAPAKLDSYGREMTTGDPLLNFLNSNILPGTLTEYTPDETIPMLNEVYNATGDAGIFPDRNAPNSFQFDGAKVELTTEEKRQYLKDSGGAYREYLLSLEKDEGFKALGDAAKAEVMRDAKALADEIAKSNVLAGRDAGIDVLELMAEVDGYEKWVAANKAGVSTADYLKMKTATKGMTKLADKFTAIVNTKDVSEDNKLYMMKASATGGTPEKIQAAYDAGFSVEKIAAFQTLKGKYSKKSEQKDHYREYGFTYNEWSKLYDFFN